MRCSWFVFSLAVGLLLGTSTPGWAQWTSNKVDVYGMFGHRSLGRTLTPSPSRAFDGLHRGPSGNFLGRGRPRGGMMFGLTPAQQWSLLQREPVAASPTIGRPVPVGPSELRVPPQPAVVMPAPIRPPQVVQPPEPVVPPDIWFRSRSGR
ncbi:MAG: hypothetical protein JXB62_22525 [Pirellulales bacterium]|nr:hypothetical protein [Pirellulales bacterium]